CLTIAISYVFNINIRLNNLLVDYVLAILTVAALVGIFVYQRQPRIQAAHVALFSGTLLLVKNSAAFFVAIIVFYYLSRLIKQLPAGHWFKTTLRVAGLWLSTLAVGALPFIWWEIHVKLTFTASKHEINAQAYSNQLSHDGLHGFISIGQ